jgi:hypothetical protein
MAVVMAQAPDLVSGVAILLWPATAFRALAPRVRATDEGRLDVFEEVSLGLIAAGVSDPRAIAKLVRLDHRLVQHILRELAARHLVKDGRVTEYGARALHDDEPAIGEAVLGHVFRDGSTGEMWPRFLDGPLPFAECDWRGEVPVVELGSTGRPRPHRATVVPPPSHGGPRPPNHTEIRQAVEQHRRALGAHAITDDWSGEVRPVDTFGQPVFLLLALVPADALETGQAWAVIDPFGGRNPMLNNWVSARAERHGRLKQVIERVAGARRREVELPPDDPITPAIAALPAARELVFALRAALADAVANPENQRRLRDAAVTIDLQLARVLRLLLAAHPPKPDRRNAIVGDVEHLRALLSDTLALLGFDPVPPSLLAVPRSAIRGALDRSEGLARALLLACALAALDHPEHPLRALAQSWPEILLEIAALLDAAQASHSPGTGRASAGGDAPDVDALCRHAGAVERLVIAASQSNLTRMHP